MMERLQKVLARAGFGSRRHCETLITDGRVTVDGAVVRQLGTRVDPERARVVCNGLAVRPQRFVYYAVHKPRGVLCTNRDPQGRKTALDLLPPIRERVYCVGRLDEDSEGLLLMTNDGALCNLLTHPRYGVRKTYHVVVRGSLEGRALERVQKGVWLAEGRTSGARILIKKRTREITVVEMTVAEGMNREIRRVFARVGHGVDRLKRIRIGPVELGTLPPGLFRSLDRSDVEALRTAATRPSDASEPARPSRPFPRRSRPPRGPSAGGGERPPGAPRRPSGPRRFRGPGRERNRRGPRPSPRWRS
jgi:23S rRNA pseudouridine2605 synthase